MFFRIIKKSGWGISAGHIEEEETWIEAAKREMYEETGATKIELEPICVYKINSYALLCYCEMLEIDELPKEYEIEKIMFSNELPENLIFPEAYRLYFDILKKEKGIKDHN